MRPLIIVIGAGIVGAAAAWARNGARVTVFEQNLPAAGASSKSFGWINASFAETPAYFRLRRAAVEAWHRLAADIGRPIPLVTGGSLWWQDQGAAFEAQAQHLAALGYASHEIGTDAFRRFEPAIADPPERCLHGPGEAAIDGAAMTAIFLAAAAEDGASVIVGAEVTGLQRQGSRVTGVQTAFGQHPSDHTLIAAGSASAALMDGAGLTLPMTNGPGLILRTTPVATRLNHLILSPEIHFRQEPDGSLVAGEIFSGAGPDAAPIQTDPVGLAAELLARLGRFLPGAGPLAIARINLGIRPVPGDGLPAIGRLAAAPGLYLATMLKRHHAGAAGGADGRPRAYG